MNLKTYIKALHKIAEKHDNLEVVFAKDDEGNQYHPVVYTPTLGVYNNGEFISAKDPSIIKEKIKLNAVCVN